MEMRIVQRRHDRLAGQIDTNCSGRRLDRSSRANRRDASIPHDECAVLDGSACIADNQTRALIDRVFGL